MKHLGLGILLALVAPFAVATCHCRTECHNGDCVCPQGSSCEITCDAPPCHVTCEGDNPQCDAACGNGDCACGPGSHCDFTCHSPPCHVSCDERTDCSGSCANGECLCTAGSRCDFTCDAGPCHVQCEGDHPECNGVCANGTCTCGPRSSCAFTCADDNCHTFCEEGSQCLLTCSPGHPNTQGCFIDECAAGEVTLCPDGITLSCGGAPCPESSPPMEE